MRARSMPGPSTISRNSFKKRRVMSKSNQNLLDNYRDKSVLTRRERLARVEDQDTEKLIRFALASRNASEVAQEAE